MENVMIAEPYFKDDEGLIQEFEVDYKLVNDFDTALAWRTSWCCPCLLLPCFYLAFSVKNIPDRNNAIHVAVTQDGIRYIRDHHKTLCRCDCTDKGRRMKTVPFDKITDCDVQEPGGASGPCCCMVKNVVTEVHVDTASSGTTQEGIPKHELVIRGLKDPHGFKKLVWQVKRNGMMGIPSAAAASSAASSSLETPFQMSKESDVGVLSRDAEVIPLLRRQNELLEEHSRLLKLIAAAKNDPPSAPQVQVMES